MIFLKIIKSKNYQKTDFKNTKTFLTPNKQNLRMKSGYFYIFLIFSTVFALPQIPQAPLTHQPSHSIEFLENSLSVLLDYASSTFQELVQEISQEETQIIVKTVLEYHKNISNTIKNFTPGKNLPSLKKTILTVLLKRYLENVV